MRASINNHPFILINKQTGKLVAMFSISHICNVHAMQQSGHNLQPMNSRISIFAAALGFGGLHIPRAQAQDY